MARKSTRQTTKAEKKEKKSKSSFTTGGFFERLVKATENDLAQAASSGILAGDVTGWIDTGVYILNAQVSGSMFGGVPNNKIIVFAGPEATGKTYFVLSIVKDFLDKNPEAGVFFFESEGAISKKMLEDRGIDPSRVFIVPVSTVQEWRTQALKVLKIYKETPEKDRRPMLFVLDSLGMLSTTKEMEDSESGKETADMTRSRLIKAAFRTLTLKMGVLNVPFLVTNHTYDTQGLYSTKVMSGGSGTKYANSLTIFLSKTKAKDGDDISGVYITSKLKKGRITKENTEVTVYLDYAKGLDKYFGLLDLAIKYDVVKEAKKEKGEKEKKQKQKGWEFPNGEIGTEKQIERNPERFFTPEVLAELEVAAAQEFNYGFSSLILEDEEDGIEPEEAQDGSEEVEATE